MKKRTAVILILALAMALLLTACKSSDYKKAISSFEAGDYAEARASFAALGDYEDSADYLKKCDYQLALRSFEEEDYPAALELFAALGDYEDSEEYAQKSQYQIALAYMDDGDYESAIEAFSELGDYEDSPEQITHAKWSMLYDYIESNGETTDLGDGSYKALSVAMPGDNDYTLYILGVDDSKIVFHSRMLATGTGFVIQRNFSVGVIRNADTALWDGSFALGLKVSGVTSISMENGKGSVDLTTCTTATKMELESYSNEMQVDGKVTKSTTSTKDETITSTMTKAWEEMMETVPGMLEDTGLPITMADLGFAKIG